MLLLRVGLGLVFVFHGYQKVTAMEQTIGFFATIGISAFWTYAAAWAELLGGALLIAGLFVRYAGIALSVVMIVAIYVVHYKNGFSLANGGYEYALLLLLGSLALVFTGAGKYSLAGLLKHRVVCETCEVGRA
jgi:putative oxidoreductase